eukprot:7731642-Alexandrium_andersonii.AAC.1
MAVSRFSKCVGIDVPVADQWCTRGLILRPGRLFSQHSAGPLVPRVPLVGVGRPWAVSSSLFGVSG